MPDSSCSVAVATAGWNWEDRGVLVDGADVAVAIAVRGGSGLPDDLDAGDRVAGGRRVVKGV
jgi:hypothetical protein